MYLKLSFTYEGSRQSAMKLELISVSWQSAHTAAQYHRSLTNK